MSILRALLGSSSTTVSGTTADQLGSATALTSASRLVGFQPENTSAPKTLVAMTPDQLAAYIGANVAYVATLAMAASPTANVLDHTLHGRTGVATSDTIIQAPSVVANLGGAGSGDGFHFTLLNPLGKTITFAGNGANVLSIAGGATTASAVGVYEFYGAFQGGATTITVRLPASSSGVTTPTLTYASSSSTQPGAANTVTYNFAGGQPGTANLAIDGGTAVASSSNTVASGTGATAAGTVTFAVTNPAAGTHTLAAASTGTYAATAASYSLVIAASPTLTFGSVSSTVPGASATIVYTYAGGTPSGAALTIDSVASSVVPQISSTSGSGASAAGTITWTGVTVPAAGSHTIAATTSGTYAVTAAVTRSWVTATPAPFAVTAVAPASVGNITAGQVLNITYTGTWAVPTVTVDGAAVTPAANSAGSGGVGTVTLPVNATAGAHVATVQGASGSVQTTGYFLNSGATNPYAGQFVNTSDQPPATYTSPAGFGAAMYVITAYGGDAGIILAANTRSGDANNTYPASVATVVAGFAPALAAPPPATINGHSNQGTLNSTAGGNFGTFFGGGNWPYLWGTGAQYASLIITDTSGGKWLLQYQTAAVGS